MVNEKFFKRYGEKWDNAKLKDLTNVLDDYDRMLRFIPLEDKCGFYIEYDYYDSADCEYKTEKSLFDIEKDIREEPVVQIFDEDNVYDFLQSYYGYLKWFIRMLWSSPEIVYNEDIHDAEFGCIYKGWETVNMAFNYSKYVLIPIYEKECEKKEGISQN